MLRKSTATKNLPRSSGTRLESIRNAHDVKGGEYNNRTERMDDYLEVIYELIEQKGYATSVDISTYLNVSAPSVTRMLKKLDENGYLNYEKYRGIRLTDEGVVIAKNIRKSHTLLVEFLKMIGVDDDTSNRDAEGIEHHLHPETLKKLEGFVKATKKDSKIRTESNSPFDRPAKPMPV